MRSRLSTHFAPIFAVFALSLGCSDTMRNAPTERGAAGSAQGGAGAAGTSGAGGGGQSSGTTGGASGAGGGGQSSGKGGGASGAGAAGKSSGGGGQGSVGAGGCGPIAQIIAATGFAAYVGNHVIGHGLGHNVTQIDTTGAFALPLGHWCGGTAVYFVDVDGDGQCTAPEPAWTKAIGYGSAGSGPADCSGSDGCKYHVTPDQGATPIPCSKIPTPAGPCVADPNSTFIHVTGSGFDAFAGRTVTISRLVSDVLRTISPTGTFDLVANVAATGAFRMTVDVDGDGSCSPPDLVRDIDVNVTSCDGAEMSVTPSSGVTPSTPLIVSGSGFQCDEGRIVYVTDPQPTKSGTIAGGGTFYIPTASPTSSGTLTLFVDIDGSATCTAADRVYAVP